MARRRLESLERVLGANALFSTAYGNVGSSIYYALGLVAALALGLTPIVFILTGALFYCTATTYAEATAMYPEAGGSSLFARRAFNELLSFFTAWAQMLNYIITIAISAFFAAHYAGGVASEWLQESPGDIVFAVGRIVVLGLFLVFDPDLLARNLDFFGTAPTWDQLLLAIPVGTVAYTGIETIS